MQYNGNQQGQYPPQQYAQQGQYPPQQQYVQQGQYPPQQGQYPPQQGHYPPQQMQMSNAGTAPGQLPEWKRIMEYDFFDMSLPCCGALCCPQIVQGIAAYKISGNILDFFVIFCCMPFVCCCYRTSNKRALGMDMSRDSCCSNMCAYWFCWCFAAGQEYRAASAWNAAGSPSNAVPAGPVMY